MEAPAWALSVAYWIHMIATVVWVGGLAALGFVVLPSARQALDAGAFAVFLEKVQRRLDPLSWLSLAVLVATGLFQMSASPFYKGFLAINNRWAVAILSKHALVGLMIAVSAYMTWVLLPNLRRIALLEARGRGTSEAERLRNRELFLLRLNLAFGILVLALTAVARTS
jgi:uncharacterized membrane protein